MQIVQLLVVVSGNILVGSRGGQREGATKVYVGKSRKYRWDRRRIR